MKNIEHKTSIASIKKAIKKMNNSEKETHYYPRGGLSIKLQKGNLYINRKISKEEIREAYKKAINKYK